ncbi:MAG: ETC complex I subunit [Rhodobacteraceae bacterium]|nr:ETC complex I subunit [Paracoccaceae bacterium]
MQDRAGQARIYQPARSATQSGQGRTREWILDFAPAGPQALDPLMGWTGSGDTGRQVRLRFPDRAAAEAYARARGIAYVVAPPQPRRPNIRPGGYGENFATTRRGSWTH